MAEERVEEVEWVCKCEDTRAEWVMSGVIIGVAGQILGRGRPDTMAVVRLAFLRVVQDFISVVDLMPT